MYFVYAVFLIMIIFFHTHYLYCSNLIRPEEANVVKHVDKSVLWAQAHVLFLHLPVHRILELLYTYQIHKKSAGAI